MTQLRQMLHEQIAQAPGCDGHDEYRRKKSAVLKYLRCVHPAQFPIAGGRRRACERRAELEGITVEEKMEDLALTGFLLQRLFLATKKEDALAALADSGLPVEDLLLLEKIYTGSPKAPWQ